MPESPLIPDPDPGDVTKTAAPIVPGPHLEIFATRTAPPDPPDEPGSGTPRTATYNHAARTPFSTALSAELFDGSNGPPGYEVLRELDRGGMGVVYYARQRHLNREVALKMVLGTERVDERTLIRFLAEAEAVAAVKHTNVVQVYEFGQHAGRPFMAMEYLPGGTLKGRMAAGPLAPAVAAEYISKIAAGVQAVHERGIVHRDLKPANVLFDATGEPKVTDFGVAKRDTLDITKSGAILGTPAYMPPEQFLNTKFVGPQADVWALGVILYECLTGARPFAGDSVMEIQLRVQSETPILPRKRLPGIPRNLELICLKCLETDATRRYPTAAALFDDIRRWREGRPILARPATVPERVIRWTRRNPAGAALIALIGVTVVSLSVGGFAIALYQSQKAQNYAKELDGLRRIDSARTKFREDLILARQQNAKGAAVEAKALYEKLLAVIANTPEVAQPPDDENQLRAELKDADKVLERLRQRDEIRVSFEKFRQHRFTALYFETLFTGSDPADNLAKAKSEAGRALALFGLAADPVLEHDIKNALSSEALTDSEKADLRTGCQELLLVQAGATARPRPELLPSQPDRIVLAGIVGSVATSPTWPTAERKGAVENARRILQRAAVLNATGGSVPRAIDDWLAAYHRELGGTVPHQMGPTPSDHSVDLFFSVLESYQRGDLNAAMQDAGKLLKLRPNHFWGNYLLAVCQLRQGKYEASQTGLTACLVQKPDFHLAGVLLAFSKGQLRDVPTAIEEFNKVLESTPDPLTQYLALNFRGMLHSQQANAARSELDSRAAVFGSPAGVLPHVLFVQAEADFRKAMAIRPDLYLAYQNLAQTQLFQADLEAAAATLDRAVNNKLANVPDLFRTRGKISLLRKDRQSALRDFDATIELGRLSEPPLKRAEDYQEVARLLQSEERFVEALERINQSIAIEPTLATSHRLRAEVLIALGRVPEAGQALARYFELVGNRVTVRDYRLSGVLRAKLGQYPAAAEAYSQAFNLAVSESDRRAVLIDRAAVYLLLDAHRLALADYVRVLQSDPTDSSALCGRAEAHFRLGQFREGLANLETFEKSLIADFRQLCLAARVRAIGFQRMTADPSLLAQQGLDADTPVKSFTACLAFLRRAVATQPPESRSAQWNRYIRPDPAFAAMWDTPAMRALDLSIAGK